MPKMSSKRSAPEPNEPERKVKGKLIRRRVREYPPEKGSLGAAWGRVAWSAIASCVVVALALVGFLVVTQFCRPNTVVTIVEQHFVVSLAGALHFTSCL